MEDGFDYNSTLITQVPLAALRATFLLCFLTRSLLLVSLEKQ